MRVRRSDAWLSVIVLLCLVRSHRGWSQQQFSGAALLQRLGYPADARLLILHADDVGMSHSVDAATFEAFEKGFVSSASIMVPCPWLEEAAAFARQHPEYDFGLHLTLTSEWRGYRWGPIVGREAKSLVDAEGYFPARGASLASHAELEEAGHELAAQLDKARALGIHFSHLDNHMGALSQSAGLFAAYLHTARLARVPNFVQSGELKAYASQMPPADLETPVPESLDPADNPDPVEGFRETFAKIGPGLYLTIVHLGHDDAELRAIMGEDGGGAKGRQRDFDTVSDPQFRDALQKNHIQLVSWREIAARFYGSPGASDELRIDRKE